VSFKIKWNPSPNFSVGRRKYDYQTESILAIVNHKTAGKFPGCLSWMCNPQAEASAHYLITRAGEIYQLVKDEDTSWHGGIVNKPNWNLYNSIRYNPNRYTIGIEHEDYDGDGEEGLTEIQYQASMWLHNQLIKKYNIPIDTEHIVGHYRIDSVNRPNCPGNAFPWDKLFTDLKGGTQVEQWKLDIIAKAKNMGIVSTDHNPDEPATKWFVLAVIINMIEKYILKIT